MSIEIFRTRSKNGRKIYSLFFIEIIMCVLFIYGLKGYAFMPATCEACNVRPNMQCLKVTSLFSSTAENFKHVFTLTHMPLLSKSYICVYVLKTIKTLPLLSLRVT